MSEHTDSVQPPTPVRTSEHAQTALLNELETRCGSELVQWLVEQKAALAQAALTQSEEVSLGTRLLTLLGSALIDVSRRFGRRHLVIAFAERANVHLPMVWGDGPVGHWLRDETAKVWLLSALTSDVAQENERFNVLYEIYDGCDTAGRVACLRAINFMNGVSTDGVNIIHDAGRTYLNELMEAGWCHSPFASTWLSDEEYRKAVLKSLFCEVSVDGFMRLDERADPELSRSLCEFANEREAAGRVVPMAVWRVAAYHPLPGLVARLIGRLEHPSQEERVTAAIGLGRAAHQRALFFLQDRATRESSPEVSAALNEAIQALSSLKTGDPR